MSRRSGSETCIVCALTTGITRGRELADSLWLRLSLAFVWLSTAVHVVHPYYRALGGHALDQLGLPHALMWIACAFELVLGLYVLLRPPDRALTALQVGLVIFFTLVLVVVDPPLMVHPLGALTKNIPFLTAAVAAHLLYRSGSPTAVERTLRFGVASVWITEGCFPKIFFQSSWERHFVVEHGFGAFEPGPTLVVVGVLEALSGVLLLLLPARPRRILLYLQAAALLVLPAWVVSHEPLLWLHPFGPLEKNVPILVATLLVARRCVGSEATT